MISALWIWLLACVQARSDLPVRASPDGQAMKRGAVVAGARFVVLDRRAGRGCDHDWLRIGPAAWICSDGVELTWAPPGGPTPPRDPLPYDYVLGKDVTIYPTLAAAEQGEQGTKLIGASGLVARATVQESERSFIRTNRGIVDAREVKPVRMSPFAGTAIDESIAWPLGIVAETTPIYDARGVATRDALERGFLLAGLAPAVTLPNGLRAYPFLDGRYVAARALRVMTRSDRPRGVGPRDRWLDVDRTQQALVAYDGDEPVYATLVSTAENTPLGLHRVLAKEPRLLLESTESYDDEHRYHYDTPWVLDLGDRYAVHAVYWHDAFGGHHGQGCVNLSPIDARFVFDFASPELPPGWSWVASVDADGARGTIVQIR